MGVLVTVGVAVVSDGVAGVDDGVGSGDGVTSDKVILKVSE